MLLVNNIDLVVIQMELAALRHGLIAVFLKEIRICVINMWEIILIEPVQTLQQLLKLTNV